MQTKTYITKKQTGTQDVVDHFFNNMTTGILTTDHAASSYGQPVIVADDKVLNYSEVESLTLPFSTSDDALSAARSLEAFGIRVTRETVAPVGI